MLTSISTMTLYKSGLRRPWACGCRSTRLPSTLSPGTLGSLATALRIHARSSAEGSCPKDASTFRSGMAEGNTEAHHRRQLLLIMLFTCFDDLAGCRALITRP